MTASCSDPSPGTDRSSSCSHGGEGPDQQWECRADLAPAPPHPAPQVGVPETLPLHPRPGPVPLVLTAAAWVPPRCPQPGPPAPSLVDGPAAFPALPLALSWKPELCSRWPGWKGCPCLCQDTGLEPGAEPGGRVLLAGPRARGGRGPALALPQPEERLHLQKRQAVGPQWVLAAQKCGSLPRPAGAASGFWCLDPSWRRCDGCRQEARPRVCCSVRAEPTRSTRRATRAAAAWGSSSRDTVNPDTGAGPPQLHSKVGD